VYRIYQLGNVLPTYITLQGGGAPVIGPIGYAGQDCYPNGDWQKATKLKQNVKSKVPAYQAYDLWYNVSPVKDSKVKLGKVLLGLGQICSTLNLLIVNPIFVLDVRPLLLSLRGLPFSV